MNIVLGAAGQVGAAIVEHLVKANVSVKGVVRNAQQTEELNKKGVLTAIADSFDLPALQSAFKDGDTVFLLTPETEQSQDVLGDARRMLANYKAALEASSIKKVVGLSSIGAQCMTNSGNLEMSFMLEHAFSDMNIQQIFVRPAYYFSNWMPYLPTVKEQGVLPTFYPVDLKIPMASPLDVAAFVAEVMLKQIEGSPIYEVEGPEWYSSRDVAEVFGEILGQQVEVRQTPKENWQEQLQRMNFTPDAVRNFIQMTERVIDGQANPERQGTIAGKTQTTLKQYITNTLDGK